MKKVVKIYTLTDPNTNLVMYVGKTILRICNRMSSHIHCAKHFTTPRDIWIKELLDNNQRPVATIIEYTDIINWEIREQFWIAFYRNLNSNLCNITKGGGGVLGTTFQDERVKSLSNIHSKPIYQLNYDYEVIKLFPSAKIAGLSLKGNGSCISNAAKSQGKKSAYGYIWIYQQDYTQWLITKPDCTYKQDYSYLCKPVKQCDLNGKLIHQWNSAQEAASALGIRAEGINKARIKHRKTYKNFLWN